MKFTSEKDDGGEQGQDEGAVSISRRTAMRAAAASGAILGGVGTGFASAGNGSTCSDEAELDGCSFKRKYEQDSLDTSLTCGCDPTADPSGCITLTNDGLCTYITTSALAHYGATHVTLKTGNYCQVHPVSEAPVKTLSLSCGSVEVRKFCSEETPDGKVHAISHVELFGCPSASVSVDCPNDRAVVDVDNTDSVYWAVDYGHCDASDADGTQTFSDSSGGTFAVPLADCEGTISVYTAEGGTLLDSAAFDCESAAVSVDCANDRMTISAPDTDAVWYEVDYEHCDESDVSRTKVDLSTTDTVTVPVADCEGTVTLTDDDGRTLDSATFDCETAGVSVDCAANEATISAPDSSELWYEVEYAHCDESDVSRTMLDFGTTDSLTVPIADCEGTLTLTDDDGRTLDSATFDCETASVSVDCPSDADSPVATISGADTSTVTYSVDYADGCTDVSGTADLSGSTDSVTVPLENCDGTVTLTDDDGRTLDSATFEPCCTPCPSGLEMKFEGGEIAEGNSRTFDGMTFTITSVTTKSGSDDVVGVCFTTDEAVCGSTFEVTVKTGEFEKTANLSAENGEYCFHVDDGERPFEDGTNPVQGVSHFTIRCA